MDVFFTVLIILLGFLLLSLIIVLSIFAYIFFEGTVHLRKSNKKSESIKPAKPYPINEVIEKRRAEGDLWLNSLNPELVYIKSFDGLKLGAEFIPSKIKGSKKTFIGVHGYMANGHSDFGVSGQLFYEMGYNLLLVSQRAHRHSEGEYVSFGVHERRDCLAWINYINERVGEDGSIFLYGISMGSTTVTMTLGFEELPASVKGCIADCGLTSGSDIFWKVAWGIIKNTPVRILPRRLIVWACSVPCRIFAKFGLEDYSTLTAVRKTKVPVLFIHGSLDDFVPRWMTEKNYNECASEKELLIVEGACHAVSYLHSPEICKAHISAFVEKYQ